jgi:flagellar motor protein MotB
MSTRASTDAAATDTAQAAPDRPHSATPAPAHAGHEPAAGHGQEHGKGHGHKKHSHHHEDEGHHGPPPWLISFGDMMTLLLCFFLILLMMGPKADAGLVAKGLGAYVVALEGTGVAGALDGAKTLAKVNEYRKRFGLEEISQEEMASGQVEAKKVADVRALLDTSLMAYSEMLQPLVARFAPASSELTAESKRFLDLIAETLRPGFGQTLVLEGSARTSDDGAQHADSLLAANRAQAVRKYLLEHHAFVAQRVAARAFAVETQHVGAAGVDARLIEPSRDPVHTGK